MLQFTFTDGILLKTKYIKDNMRTATPIWPKVEVQKYLYFKVTRREKHMQIFLLINPNVDED